MLPPSSIGTNTIESLLPYLPSRSFLSWLENVDESGDLREPGEPGVPQTMC